jgi:hypothetical protein
MLFVINGFPCLSEGEFPLARRGVNPAHPEAGVVPLRNIAADAQKEGSSKPPATGRVDMVV